MVLNISKLLKIMINPKFDLILIFLLTYMIGGFIK